MKWFRRPQKPCDAGVIVLGVTWACLLQQDHDGKHRVPMMHAIGSAGVTVPSFCMISYKNQRLGGVPGTQMLEALPDPHLFPGRSDCLV